MDKTEVKEKLQEAYMTLFDCDLAIAELNENGNQFDYVNDPRLSDVVDGLFKRINSIHKRVYQES